MASQLIKSRTSTVTEIIETGEFTLKNKKIIINGVGVPMSKATYDALKADILTAQGKEGIVSITIDSFDAVIPK